MNEEEKQAVEFVKKRTKELKKYAKRENELVYDDIILNLIEKLQKENEELKADNYELNNRISDLLENIPIQKVKDKIKELDERIKNPERNSYWASYTVSECIGIRRILQDLLERTGWLSGRMERYRAVRKGFSKWVIEEE